MMVLALARTVLATPVSSFVPDAPSSQASSARRLIFIGTDNIVFGIDTLLDDCFDSVPIFITSAS
jgi:hypothetical protein